MQVSGDARAMRDVRGSQFGGMRWGRDQAPSRIFLSAILSARVELNRLRAPSSTAQMTWRKISAASLLGTRSRICFRTRASSKTLKVRGPCWALGAAAAFGMGTGRAAASWASWAKISPRSSGVNCVFRVKFEAGQPITGGRIEAGPFHGRRPAPHGLGLLAGQPMNLLGGSG